MDSKNLKIMSGTSASLFLNIKQSSGIS